MMMNKKTDSNNDDRNNKGDEKMPNDVKLNIPESPQMSSILPRSQKKDSYGIVLFKYTINGIEYEIEKRSMKRNIYMQVLLFSVNGLYVMITDKQMKKMMFGTDSIFRETGTTSEVIENIRHSEMYRLELRRSISDK